jgi:SiaC family regulatory phosphoprotein
MALELIFLEKTTETPSIVLDPTLGVAEITGNCYPENAFEFFAPVHKWIEDFFAHGASNLAVHFNLNYINTASSKFLRELMIMLNHYYAKDKSIRVEWLYDEDDEDMEDLGKTFSLEFDMPIVVKIA